MHASTPLVFYLFYTDHTRFALPVLLKTFALLHGVIMRKSVACLAELALIQMPFSDLAAPLKLWQRQCSKSTSIKEVFKPDLEAF